jgi:hypothetical protein
MRTAFRESSLASIFRDAVVQGIVHGRNTANWVVRTQLEPMKGEG